MQKEVKAPMGRVFYCPLCGAEILVIKAGSGELEPHCCNRAMVAVERKIVFYVCPLCGAEVAVIKEGKGKLEAHCCNRPMELKHAA